MIPVESNLPSWLLCDVEALVSCGQKGCSVCAVAVQGSNVWAAQTWLGCGNWKGKACVAWDVAGSILVYLAHRLATCVIKDTQENGYAGSAGGTLSPGQQA